MSVTIDLIIAHPHQNLFGVCKKQHVLVDPKRKIEYNNYMSGRKPAHAMERDIINNCNPALNSH